MPEFKTEVSCLFGDYIKYFCILLTEEDCSLICVKVAVCGLSQCYLQKKKKTRTHNKKKYTA